MPGLAILANPGTWRRPLSQGMRRGRRPRWIRSTLEGGGCEGGPVTLRPPVEPMLAQAAESVPGPAAVRAGVAYEH
ncbi:hypothetical protein GCM10010302_78650 [Streptomyces polychromogenes]|uniref:Uncharacterized protein n=1 Tax=Streptomyces polychromogenes TaxID=67342 RepID=A0ABP3FW17_9ACTN